MGNHEAANASDNKSCGSSTSSGDDTSDDAPLDMSGVGGKGSATGEASEVPAAQDDPATPRPTTKAKRTRKGAAAVGAPGDLDQAEPPDTKSKATKSRKTAAKSKAMRETISQQKMKLKEKGDELKALQSKFDRWRARNPKDLLSQHYAAKGPEVSDADRAEMMTAWALQIRDASSPNISGILKSQPSTLVLVK